MIPEAAVEAAAKAHHSMMTGGGLSEWGYIDKDAQEGHLSRMRAALEAALPHMIATTTAIPPFVVSEPPRREGLSDWYTQAMDKRGWK